MQYTDEDYLNFAEIAYSNLKNIDKGKTTLNDIFYDTKKTYWRYETETEKKDYNKNFDYFKKTFGFTDDKGKKIVSPYKDYVILDYVHKDDRDNKSENGFGAIALQAPDGDIIISFRDTDGAKAPEMINHNFNQGFVKNFYSATQDQEAIKFAGDIISKYPNSKIHFTGHSLGGHLAQVAGVEYIENENVETIFGWDPMGVQKNLLDMRADDIKKFIKRGGKYILYELGIVSQLLEQPDIEGVTHHRLVQNYNKDDDKYNDLSEIHILEFIREDLGLKFENGKFVFEKDDILYFEEGRLEDSKSKFWQGFWRKATKLPVGGNDYKYKDISTGIMMQVTQKRDNLTIDEFLKKYNANYKWKNGKIVEKIKTRKLKENPQYLVRGAIIKCSRGTNVRRIDLSKCHGVYFKSGPALHLEDCIVGEYKNIKSFGFCERNNLLGPDFFPCEPDILETWLYAHDNTYIVRNDAKKVFEKYIVSDLLNALTENSFLVCANGGLIEVVTSGQEYNRGILDIVLGEKLLTLDSEGMVSRGSNVDSEEVTNLSKIITDGVQSILDKTTDKIQPIIDKILDKKDMKE